MESKDQESKSANFRRPRLTLAWTIFAVAAIAFMTIGMNWINERADIQPGIVNILKIFLVFITVIVWFGWLLFFSRHRFRFVIAPVAMSLFLLFFYLFRIVFDGDMGFVRIESRFNSRQFNPGVAETNDKDAVKLGVTSSGDFDQFLGNERRDSTIRNRVLNANWKENPPKILWRQPVGEGWSGFAAVNGFAITQEQRGTDECVTCYDIETGELKWIHSAKRRHEDQMSMGKVGPRSTPTIHNGLVYAQGATGVLECLNGHDGSLIWEQNIPDLLGTEMTTLVSLQGLEYEFEEMTKSTLAWGRSGSPLIFDDLVITLGGAKSDGTHVTLMAFNKKTGDEVWQGGSDMIAYGSPAIADLLGSKQITLVAESAGVGYDPKTGKELWRSERRGASNMDANTSQVTRINDNQVILSKGYGEGGELVELSRDGDSISPRTIWKNQRVLKTKMMSPVILDGHAYCLSDGFLECCDLGGVDQEPRRKWRKRRRFGNGQLLLVGQHLLVHTENGLLLLVEATPEKYNELGQFKTIDGICWNTLCLYKNLLLVRSELEAACIELKTEVQSAEVPESTESTDDQAASNNEANEAAVGSGDE